MTYRELYFQLKKKENKYLNNTAIKTLLQDDGGFNDFFNLISHFDEEVKDLNKINKNIERITNGEPLQYVVGYAFFVKRNTSHGKSLILTCDFLGLIIMDKSFDYFFEFAFHYSI